MRARGGLRSRRGERIPQRAVIDLTQQPGDAMEARELVRRVLRPTRPKDAAARECARDARDVRELWESLVAREVVPAEWAASDRRAFHAVNREVSEIPPTVDAALALAADPAGIITAEASAREFAALLYEGRSGAPDAVVWSCAPPGTMVFSPQRPGAALLAQTRQPAQAPGAVSSGWRRLASALWSRVTGESDTPEAPSTAPDAPVQGLLIDARVLAESEGFALSPHAATALCMDLAHEALFAERRPDARNVFGPLRRIWSLGYALDAIDARALTLLAPTTVRQGPWARVVHVAGFSYENRVRHLPSLAMGHAVALVREPDNGDDPSAIRIESRGGQHLGYVPRSLALTLAVHLDAGVAHRAHIERIEPEGPTERRVFVRISEAV